MSRTCKRALLPLQALWLLHPWQLLTSDGCARLCHIHAVSANISAVCDYYISYSLDRRFIKYGIPWHHCITREYIYWPMEGGGTLPVMAQSPAGLKTEPEDQVVINSQWGHLEILPPAVFDTLRYWFDWLSRNWICDSSFIFHIRVSKRSPYYISSDQIATLRKLSCFFIIIKKKKEGFYFLYQICFACLSPIISLRLTISILIYIYRYI